MDPSNNLVPGIDPDELAAAAAAEANQLQEAAPAPEVPAAPEIAMPEIAVPEPTLEPNPAADIAAAAMAGAEPVVTTTDLNAADVAPEPTLQTVEAPAPEAPILETPTLEAPAADAPAEEGPVALAPSADFEMGEVSTVSALQNGADGNFAVAADEVMIGQPLEQPAEAAPDAATQPENPMDDPTVDQLANTEMGNGDQTQNPGDFNDPNAAASAEADANAKAAEEENDEPIIAAAPVPGSIGSAKSYTDIQRAEAEKAAKVAAKQNSKFKLSKNTIIIIAIAVVAVIGIIVGALVMFGGEKKTTTTSPVATYDDDDDTDHEYSTLSCKRAFTPEEFGSYGAISGTYENIFYFKDDALDGLVTNFSYDYENLQIARLYRDQFMRDFGLTEEGRAGKDNESAEESEEPSTDEESEEETEETGEKTTADMLKHYVALEKFTVIHGVEVKSEDIAAWLESDAYSDRTYGNLEKVTPTSEDGEETEVTRNLDFYKTLQNSIDFTCEITKGY